MKTKILIFICKYLFTEDEKYILIQSLNTQKEILYLEYQKGILERTNFYSDLELTNNLKKYFKNKLWN